VYVPYQNYGTGVGLEYPVDFVENYVGINNMLDYLAADNHIQVHIWWRQRLFDINGDRTAVVGPCDLN